MTFADVAALAATVLSGISLLPQIRKLVRTGDVRGISPTWPVFGMVTNAAWLAYLAGGDIPVVTFGAIGVTAALLILGRYVAVVARTPAPS